jgi:hypothetical protein
VQMYIPITEYKDKVEEMYNIIKEILEEDGWGETGRMWLEMNHTETFLDHMDWKGEVRDQTLIDFWT